VATAAGYGALRHGLSGNVVPLLLLVMLSSSIPVAQVGARLVRYLHGNTIRLLLALTMLVCGIGVMVQLAQQNMASPFGGAALPTQLALVGLVLVVTLALLLNYYARRYRHGARIPGWARSLVIPEKETLRKNTKSTIKS
jgi:hypothetical protein